MRRCKRHKGSRKVNKKITVTLVYVEKPDKDVESIRSDIWWALCNYDMLPDLITTNAILVEDDDDTEV